MSARAVLGERLVHARVGQVGGAGRVGRRASTAASGRGRSSPLVGSATCWPSSSSPRVNTSWTSRRRWRRGCGCWGRAVPTRTTRTTPARSRSRRCGRRRWCRCGSRTTRRCCGCWRVGTPRSRWARNKAVCRLHALVCELVAGRDRQRSRCFPGVRAPRASSNRPARSADERHRLALELVDDIARYDDQRKALRMRGSGPRSPRRARPSPRSSGSVTSSPRR